MNNPAKGVLQLLPKGSGFLWDMSTSLKPNPKDIFVPQAIIKKNQLVEGAYLSGTVSEGKKGPVLENLDSICGLTLEKFRERTSFENMVVIDPNERFHIGKMGNKTMRIVELVSPIGKGTRGMIVSPPKAGKTIILEEMAKAIHACSPDTRIIVLLIDERPEEVTAFRRSVEAEVLASSSDQNTSVHIRLVELAMAHIRCELECGSDIVVLVDSLTRLARAFNVGGSSSNRTMSGGLDAKALVVPRRFFGLARNIEHGGSITVIATALVDTGSRMDNLIFEEFKGTGNSEIVLDRSLAESRVFPAIDVLASGTRKEELLYSDEEMDSLTRLHRRLADGKPKDNMNGLIKLIDSTKDNSDLFSQI